MEGIQYMAACPVPKEMFIFGRKKPCSGLLCCELYCANMEKLCDEKLQWVGFGVFPLFWKWMATFNLSSVLYWLWLFNETQTFPDWYNYMFDNRVNKLNRSSSKQLWLIWQHKWRLSEYIPRLAFSIVCIK